MEPDATLATVLRVSGEKRRFKKRRFLERRFLDRKLSDLRRRFLKRRFLERQLSDLYDVRRAILESFKEDVNLSIAGQVFDLPFPSINNLSFRFSPPVALISPQEKYEVAFPYRFTYIGRSRYESLKAKVLSMRPALSRARIQLKVSEAPYGGWCCRSLYMYGTTGSGKSHLLAALACELYAMFARVEGQNQRVLFVPSCQNILLSFVDSIKVALKFAYCENRDVCATIDSFKNENDLLAFFKEESEEMTCIYFLVDDYNAIDQRPDIKSWLSKFSENHIEVLCGTPTSENLQIWLNKKHYEEVYAVFGGLNADEYDGFKRCLPGLKNLDDMTEENVKHLTGSIPLFLTFWNKDHKKALKSFLSNQEIIKASQNIKQMMVKQLGDERRKNDWIRIYLSFLNSSIIDASAEYDWRYTYVDENRIGYIVCGYYMQVISDLLHSEEIEKIEKKYMMQIPI